MASAANSQPRLHTQNLAAEVSARRKRQLAGRVAVEGARQAQAQCSRSLRFERKIGEHAAHQRLIDQSCAESLAMVRVMQRLDDGLAHHAGAAHTRNPGA